MYFALPVYIETQGTYLELTDSLQLIVGSSEVFSQVIPAFVLVAKAEDWRPVLSFFPAIVVRG